MKLDKRANYEVIAVLCRPRFRRVQIACRLGSGKDAICANCQYAFWFPETRCPSCKAFITWRCYKSQEVEI